MLNKHCFLGVAWNGERCCLVNLWECGEFIPLFSLLCGCDSVIPVQFSVVWERVVLTRRLHAMIFPLTFDQYSVPSNHFDCLQLVWLYRGIPQSAKGLVILKFQSRRINMCCVPFVVILCPDHLSLRNLGRIFLKERDIKVHYCVILVVLLVFVHWVMFVIFFTLSFFEEIEYLAAVRLSASCKRRSEPNASS